MLQSWNMTKPILFMIYIFSNKRWFYITTLTTSRQRFNDSNGDGQTNKCVPEALCYYLLKCFLRLLFL